ncbi:MAG: 50S ribosomal protein L6 [Patescibacteria group bacterium]|nr:50S ribosomal protein L6 [Patescibacteria group bacterium]
MSRLAKKPIVVPDGVEVHQEKDFLVIKGTRGMLTLPFLRGTTAKFEDKNIFFDGTGEKKWGATARGTMWALTRNAIEGVSQGFEKNLELEGVGYRAVIEGKDLVLHLGFSNPIRFTIPEGIAIVVEKNKITVSGINKELVGEVSAQIRSYKKPEPYKGKGIRYKGEIIRRKAGKKAASSGGSA